MHCGHDVMVDLPEDLTRELLAVAARALTDCRLIAVWHRPRV